MAEWIDAALSGVEAKETHTGSNPVLTTQCWLQGPIREVHLNKTRTGKTPNLQITAKYQRKVKRPHSLIGKAPGF